MKHLRRTALLVLSAALGLSLAPAASASTDPPVGPAAPTNFIRNWDYYDGISIGVIHQRDGDYTRGQYDALLPPLADTYNDFGWSNAAGFYIGPGWCTMMDRSSNLGHTWERQFPDLGPGQHFIGLHTTYRLMPYPANGDPCGS